MTYIDKNICELTQVHQGKVVWNTKDPLGWTIGWDTVAQARVSPLAELLQPGLELHFSLVGQCCLDYRVPLSSVLGWDTVAWARVSPLAGLLQPGLECTP